MSGGFTPFDKNSYKESKRRRKQALIEEKTGRILPVSNPRRRYIAIISVGVILVAAIAFGIFQYLKVIRKVIPKLPNRFMQKAKCC